MACALLCLISHAWLQAMQACAWLEHGCKGKQSQTSCTRVQEERSQCLWQALERFIPDIRDRTELTLVGTPLTHERYLLRHRGTYGAAISAASGSFPGPQTPLPGLYRCDT